MSVFPNFSSLKNSGLWCQGLKTEAFFLDFFFGGVVWKGKKHSKLGVKGKSGGKHILSLRCSPAAAPQTGHTSAAF